MNNVERIIALGGLFHDIGKVLQRAQVGKGTHSERGAKFLRELAEKTEIEEYKIIALFSEFHHEREMSDAKIKSSVKRVQPEKFGISETELINAIWLIDKADNISSSEREEDSRLNIKNPLKSIFTSVDIEKGKAESRYYPVTPLNFEDELLIPQKEILVRTGDYRFLKERIERELENLGGPNINKVLAILEHYLTFVPTMTSKENDISLYDHMRMTSAIALALYHYHRSDFKSNPEKFKEKLNTNEKKLLLIGADFSGIQDFIYTINMRGALKYLRARSTYLDLLGWDVALEIVERLRLTRANIIYNGGGSFTILAQNTEDAKNQLKKIRKEISDWLYKNFNGKLYLAIDWIEMSLEDIRDLQKGRLWEELKMKVNKRKTRRFEEILENGFFIDKEGIVKRAECDVCKKQITSEEYNRNPVAGELHVCDTCRMLWSLGDKLPKIKGFLRIEKNHRTENLTHKLSAPFSEFLTLELDIKKSIGVILEKIKPERIEVFVKNSFDISLIPEEAEFIPYIVADYAKIVKDDDGEHVITFEQLADKSVGAKRIGVLRADVDNLSLIFRFGLIKHSKLTLSRIATLSRFLDYFFKGYLNQIAQGRFWYIIDNRMSLPTLPTTLKENECPNIVIVYAGGDDLFIVGSWNEIFNLAFRIRELFRKYVGDNPNITISAGLGFFDENYPLARMAEITRGRLETAKNEGRNRISLLERMEVNKESFREFAETHKISYEWDHYKKLWGQYASNIYDERRNELKKIKDKKLSKSLLWKILQAQELYVRNPESINWSYILAYHLSRNGVEDMFKDLIAIDTSKAKTHRPQEVYFVDGILKIILFALRG